MKEYKLTDLFFNSWSELNTDQMAAIIAYRDRLNQSKSEGLHQAHGHISIMMLRTLRKNKSLVAKINVEQAVDCINDIDFFQHPWFHFPSIKNNVSGWATPDEYLNNISFGQLVYADSMFSKYIVQDYYESQAHPSLNPSSVSLAYFDCFLAVLYTAKDSFDETKIEALSKNVAQEFTESEKIVIMHTYANVRNYFTQTLCPTLFAYDPDRENSDEAKQPPQYTGDKWQDLLYDLSETPAFQGLDKAKKALWHDALSYLEKKAKQTERSK